MTLYVIRTTGTGEYVAAPRQKKKSNSPYTDVLEHAWMLYREQDAKAYITQYNRYRNGYRIDNIPESLKHNLEIVKVSILEIGVVE